MYARIIAHAAGHKPALFHRPPGLFIPPIIFKLRPERNPCADRRRPE
jgi:hypothetical protein